MGNVSFERIMGAHAAPTLRGLKPASLISFPKKKFDDFDALLTRYLPCFRCNGISICRLGETENHVLILFYRRDALEASLAADAARELLADHGYSPRSSLRRKLAMLKWRIRVQKSFPHEIGLFLGYPPEDVRGFIEGRGRGFVYSGYWKVYANEEETRRLFARYAACTHEFCRRLEDGAAFSDLLRAG